MESPKSEDRLTAGGALTQGMPPFGQPQYYVQFEQEVRIAVERHQFQKNAAKPRYHDSYHLQQMAALQYFL